MMKKVLTAGVALAFLAGGVGVSFAQSISPVQTEASPSSHASFKRKLRYRPLTVQPAMAPAPTDTLGSAVAAPFGVAGAVAGGAVSGVGTLIQAPFAGLGGGAVGISSMAAPPLPIVARYMNTGKVSTTYDEGYSQDVPVDNSGPIYKLNYDENGVRKVTPFTLAAFPITAATTVITAPVRAVVAPHP